MIFVDSAIGSKQLLPLIPNSIETHLNSGDVYVVGSTGTKVGIERKSIHEIISSMRGDKRIIDQIRRMKQEYNINWLVVDGWHRIDYGKDTLDYYVYRSINRKRQRVKTSVQYSAIMNHLMSLVIGHNLFMPPDGIYFSINQTAQFIRLLANWYAAEDKHKSHTGVYCGRTSLMREPTRKQKIAAQLEGVEQVLSARVDKKFSSIRTMINAGVDEWMSIDGIGKKKAQTIVECIDKEE